MKKQVTIKISSELYQDLTKIKCDKAKARAIEIIGALAFQQTYPNILRIDMNNDRIKQTTEGDFVVFWKVGHDKVEVKKGTIHDFLKKLMFDIIYLNSELTDRYKQRTNGENGWLYTCNSDILMCYIEDTREFYVIKNFQTIKENLIKTVEITNKKHNLLNLYGQDLRNKVDELNEEFKNKKKPYNYHIQDDKNKYDEVVKHTLGIVQHLDKIGYVANIDIIKLDIQIE